MKLKDLLYNTKTLPFILFLLNLLLKFIYIDAQDICIDEPFTIYHAQFGIGDIIQFLKPTNNPPLFEIVLHFWINIFGISAFSVRILPLFFSSLTAVFIYKLSNKLFNPIVALVASLVFTFSSYQYYYAHDARAYSLLLLLSVCLVYVFIRLNEQNNSKYQLLFVITGVLIAYTHYFGFVVWFVLFFNSVLFFRNKLKTIIVLFTTAMACYLPQVLVFLQRTADSAQHGTWIEEGISLESLYNKIVLFSNVPVAAVFCILLLIGGIVKFVIDKQDTNQNTQHGIWLLITWFFIPFIALFLISYKVPLFLDRYLIFITPAFYILVSYFAAELFNHKAIKTISTVLLLSVFLISINLNPTKKRESQQAVNYVKEHKTDSTLVIVCAHDFINNFTYYYDIKIFTDIIAGNEYQHLTENLNRNNIYPIRKIDELPKEKLIEFKKVIFLDAAADFSNPGNGIYTTLKSNYKEKSKTHYKSIFNLYEFKRN